MHTNPRDRPIFYVFTAVRMYFALSGVVTLCVCCVVTNLYHENAGIRFPRNAGNHLRENAVPRNIEDCSAQKEHSLEQICSTVYNFSFHINLSRNWYHLHM